MQTTIKLAFIALFSIAVIPFSASAANVPSPSGDPFIGSYEGHYEPTGVKKSKASGFVISEGPELYRVIVNFEVGPRDKRQHSQLELHGRAQGERLRFSGYAGNVSWDVSLQDGDLRINRTEGGYGGVFKLEKVINTSPTAGLEAPEGATVLLPHTPGKKADMSAWVSNKWEALDDGVMRVKGRTESNTTKKSFGSFTLHLEFKIAHMPSEHGQGRSNSGVYFHDRYEVQVLDSFGLVSGSGDCGGIYQQSIPLVNASLPPGQWQTYDAEFTAATFDANGKVLTNPRLTVKHNGIVIQDNHEFKEVTGGAAGDTHVATAPIRLQDHGDPVEYRNIWVTEK